MTFFDGIGGAYFDNKLESHCYFEMEIIQENSLITIGYVHAEELQSLKDGEDLSRVGVCMCNYGTVMYEGHRVFNYELSLKYGDAIGIGITGD